MTCKINPADVCETEGCTRPRDIGSDLCVMCGLRGGQIARRLAERDENPLRTLKPEALNPLRTLKPEASDFLADETKLPRCVAYLSRAGDVITLELTGEPRFTEADVEAVADALSNRRRKA